MGNPTIFSSVIQGKTILFVLVCFTDRTLRQGPVAKGFIALPSLISLEGNPTFCCGVALHDLGFLLCMTERGPGGVCRTFGCWNTPLTVSCFSPSSFLPKPFLPRGAWSRLGSNSTGDAGSGFPQHTSRCQHLPPFSGTLIFHLIAVPSSVRSLSTSFISDPLSHPLLR